MSTLIADTSGEAYTFDSILDEKWNEPANVTEHPIDSRAPVNDHIQLLARTATVNAVVTMTPFDVQVSAGSVDATIAAVRDGSNTANAPSEGVRRLLDAIEFLRRNRQDTFTYIGARLGAVENITIENIEYPVTIRKDMRFRLDLKQIRRATGVEVDLPPVVVVPPKAKPIRECGVQSTKNASSDDETPDKRAKIRSTAYRILEWVGDRTTEEGGVGGALNSQKQDTSVFY